MARHGTDQRLDLFRERGGQTRNYENAFALRDEVRPTIRGGRLFRGNNWPTDHRWKDLGTRRRFKIRATRTGRRFHAALRNSKFRINLDEGILWNIDE